MRLPSGTVLTMVVRRLIFILALAGATSPNAVCQEIAGTIKGFIRRDITAQGTGMLSGFLFHFNKTDHPLKSISLHPNLDKLELAFADRHPSDSDDEYLYQVKLQHSSNPRIIERSASQLAIGNFDLADKDLKDSAFRERFVFVLRGFKFTYAEDDFAIKKIGILEDAGTIRVDLHDRSGHNKFNVTVDYALVPKEMIVSSSSIEGVAVGAKQVTIGAGIAVLSGFSFEYLDDDFRILELGVFAAHDTASGSNIKLLFNDLSLSRRYQYKVNYSLLK